MKKDEKFVEFNCAECGITKFESMSHVLDHIEKHKLAKRKVVVKK